MDLSARLPSSKRWLLCVLIAGLVVCTHAFSRCWADDRTTYVLHSRPQPNGTDDLAVTYEVGGSLTLPGDEKTEEVPMSVQARLAYQDRLLTPDRLNHVGDRRDMEFSERIRRRGIRYYDEVDVRIDINGQKITPALRNDRRHIMVNIEHGTSTLSSPQGSLTREELDLIDLPGDNRVAELLLPRHPVQIGSTWQPDHSALAMLLRLDAVGDSDVTSELKEMDGRYARVELQGTVHGATAGVATEIGMKARYYFDVQLGRLSSLQLVTREHREIGHVTPGVDATARLKLIITPRTERSSLAGPALVGLHSDSGSGNDSLLYHSGLLGVQFEYDRNWHVTADDGRAAVLRRMENGELIAQCNVSLLPTIKKGKEVRLGQFQQDIRKTLGKNFGTFVSAAESTNSLGHLVYRVEAAGAASQLPVRWIYYLLANTDGRRAAVVFTMEGELAKQFGTADNQIANSLEFVERQKAPAPTPASPTPASTAQSTATLEKQNREVRP